MIDVSCEIRSGEMPVERIFLRKMAEMLHEDSTVELFFDKNSPRV
jgi:hypothetical protein